MLKPLARGESQEMPILIDPETNFNLITDVKTEKAQHQEIEIIEIISEESQTNLCAPRVDYEEPEADLSVSLTAE